MQDKSRWFENKKIEEEKKIQTEHEAYMGKYMEKYKDAFKPINIESPEHPCFSCEELLYYYSSDYKNGKEPVVYRCGLCVGMIINDKDGYKQEMNCPQNED